jgi:hypothetical protein
VFDLEAREHKLTYRCWFEFLKNMLVMSWGNLQRSGAEMLFFGI